MDNLVFTDHALEQFISRADPEMPWDEAKGILEKEAKYGVYLNIPTRTGERYLYMKYIEFALIIKKDGAKNIAVTCVHMPVDKVNYYEQSKSVGERRTQAHHRRRR